MIPMNSEMFGLLDTFTPLEVLLLTSMGTLVGAIAYLARVFYKYLDKTNKERAEEIRTAVKVQTELMGVIKEHNTLIEKLPEAIHDKIILAVKSA
jgi:hypothetical protein